MTPDEFRDERDVDLRTGHEVVGIEMAEALSAHSAEVHLYEMLPHVLQPFGDAVAEVAEDLLREQGVRLHLETAVSGFEGGERVERVTLDDESRTAEVAIIGVGVEQNADLAYAPPFSPVRDPILTAAKVLEGEKAGG